MYIFSQYVVLLRKAVIIWKPLPIILVEVID